MENLKSVLEDYLRFAGPPFTAGVVIGLIIGAWWL